MYISVGLKTLKNETVTGGMLEMTYGVINNNVTFFVKKIKVSVSASPNCEKLRP